MVRFGIPPRYALKATVWVRHGEELAEAIKKGWEEWFSDTTYLHNETTSKIDTIVVSTSGNLAYVRETNHYKVKTPNGIVEFDDKCIYIYNKSKDGWKCTVDIWNYDKPQ
jgi:ketosteroid isomerase-like protein